MELEYRHPVTIWHRDSIFNEDSMGHGGTKAWSLGKALGNKHPLKPSPGICLVPSDRPGVSVLIRRTKAI